MLINNQVKAADGVGWDSTAAKPFPLYRLLRTDAENQEKSNKLIQELEKQLADKNKNIDDWKSAALALRQQNNQFFKAFDMKNCEIRQLHHEYEIKLERALRDSHLTTLLPLIFKKLFGIAFKLMVSILEICFTLLTFIFLAKFFINCLPFQPAFLNYVNNFLNLKM